MKARPEATPDFSAEQARFESFLRSRQLKLTGERRALLAAVLTWGSHFDADTLHLTLKQRGEDVSRATVYRTLDLLVQCGLVRKDSLGHSQAQYEAVKAGEHHDHLICNECGRVIEFFEPAIESLQDEVCDRYGFLALSHSHQLRGICRQCRPRVTSREAGVAASASPAKLRILPTA